MTPNQANDPGSSGAKSSSNKTVVLIVIGAGLVLIAFFGCIGAVLFGGGKWEPVPGDLVPQTFCGQAPFRIH